MMTPEPIEYFMTQPMNVDRFRATISLESIKEQRKLRMRKSERTKENNLQILDKLLKIGGEL